MYGLCDRVGHVQVEYSESVVIREMQVSRIDVFGDECTLCIDQVVVVMVNAWDECFSCYSCHEVIGGVTIGPD